MAQIPTVDPVSVDAQSNSNALLPVETPELDPSQCPKTHHLIVTTTKGVYSWSRNGITELFSSSSQRIVAAKGAPDGSGVLAVADSQVVLLHDVRKGMERSYRLKGSDGHVRLLRYANDARGLFFTTSLQNSVQTYSSKQSRLLDPLQPHPSPPTVFALSSTSHLLLSASVLPPTIYLTNLTLRTPSISLHSSCSSSAVVAASFHPERANVFLLAFADGVLAIYDAVHLFRNGGKGERKEGPAGSAKGGELGHIKGLHAASATSTSSDPDTPSEAATSSAYDERTETMPVASRSSGITAVSFLPGYTARAISAGADGKCHLIDFEAHNRRESRVVKSWHTRGPVTSLSVVPVQRGGSTTPKGRKTSKREEPPGTGSKGCLIVVGRLDGKVCLFSDSGTLRGEMTVDPAGGPILDVEWMEGSGDTVSNSSGGPRAEIQPSSSKPKPLSHSSRRTSAVKGKRNSIALSKRKSFGSLLAGGRQIKEEVLTLQGEAHKGADFAWQDAADVYAAKYMDMFSPVKQLSNNNSSDADQLTKLESKPPNPLLEQLNAVELEFPLSGLETANPISKAIRRDSRASFRPRPAPRRGSQASMRGSYTVRRGCQDDGKVIADIRRAAVPGRPTKGFALFAPYMDRKVMVDGSRSVRLGRSNTQASTVPTVSRVKTSDQAGENVWSDVVSSPPIPACTHSQKVCMDGSRKSRKNVSFQPSSVVKEKVETIVQSQPESIPSISEPSTCIPQAKDRDHHARETTSFEHTVAHRSSKEESAHGFKIHEDATKLSRTSNSPQRIRTATDAETVMSTPLEETSHNLGTIKSSHDPSKSWGNAKERTMSQNKTDAFLNEKLQEFRAALADDMRGFQAKILRQFEEHRKQIEEALVRESIARQKVVEESRLLRGELSEVRRRR